MHRHTPAKRHARGFSLIELVIVVVIVGIIAAIAVPRMSRGSEGATASALEADLTVLNKAVDLYATEHGGAYPSAGGVTVQLTTQTDVNGNLWSDGSGKVPYGPYLRAVPPLPLGEHKGRTAIAKTNGVNVGWLYDPTEGVIRPNLTKLSGTLDESMVSLVIVNTTLERDDLVAP